MALLGKKLTEKQQAIHDLQKAGRRHAEIASILGISVPVVSKTLAVVRKKLGISNARQSAAERLQLEVTNPDKVAAIMDAITEPAALKKLEQAYKECGVPPTVSSKLLARIRAKYYGGITATKNLKASEIADLFSNKIDLAARYMDDKTASEATFRDLAMAATAMSEKRQLLRGEPTQIVSDADRKKLHELLPLLIAEGRRRGITIEGQAVKVDNPAPEVVNAGAQG